MKIETDIDPTYYKIYNRHGVEIFDKANAFGKRMWYYRIMYDEFKNPEDNHMYHYNRRSKTIEMIHTCKSKKEMYQYITKHRHLNKSKRSQLKYAYGLIRKT